MLSIPLEALKQQNSLHTASFVNCTSEKMKAALIAACLLALTFTITDALDKKQNAVNCANQGANITTCIANLGSNPTSVCTGDCRTTLEAYYDACDSSGTARSAYDMACGSSETVGATIFTIVSAVLVAVGN